MGGQEFNLTFPREALAKIRPTLTKLGFTVSSEKVPDRVTFLHRTKITVLRRGIEEIFLIHLDQDLINVDSPSRDDLETMTFLEYRLPDSGPLIITSKGLDALHSQIKRIINSWEGHGLRVRFIPWRELDELPPPKSRARVHELARMLDVEPPASLGDEQVTGLLNKKLARRDQEILAEIMTRLATAELSGDYKEFFQRVIGRTKLPENWQSQISASWASTSGADAMARKIIRWADAKGWFRLERESFTGAVLGEIISSLTEECGTDDRDIILEIATKYQLLDQFTVRRLTNNEA